MSGTTSASTLRRMTLYRALHRPNLIMGGERELVMTSLLVCAALAFTAMNLPALLVGSAVYGISMALLRRMGKADPQMSTVYRRYLTYSRYYAPRTSAFAQE